MIFVYILCHFIIFLRKIDATTFEKIYKVKLYINWTVRTMENEVFINLEYEKKNTIKSEIFPFILSNFLSRCSRKRIYFVL